MNVFISYSHRDAGALERLHKHLAMLKREGAIETWYDREILAGDDIDHDISAQLEAADLFLLLVSPDFLASDYCYETEMARALERHEAGEARVILIIVEPCDWQSSESLKKLKAVPRDGQAVSLWTNENTAFMDVVTELRRVVVSGLEPVQPEASAATTAAVGGARPTDRRYRIEKTFDAIDRADFRSEAFEAFRNYFEKAITEIDGIDGLRGRFVPIDDQSFGATVVNKAHRNGEAHITVRRVRSDHRGLGDIEYSFGENVSANSISGAFFIEHDEYDLFLKAGLMARGGLDERLTPHDAAERLWEEFIDKAGIRYD